MQIMLKTFVIVDKNKNIAIKSNLNRLKLGDFLAMAYEYEEAL